MDQAIAVVDGVTVGRVKEMLLDDVYLFAKVVNGHKDLSSQFHRPLAYLMAGCTDKLIPLLSDSSYTSFLVRLLRRLLRARGIDWTDPSHRERLEALLNFVNVRIYRGAGKSSLATSVVLWKATRDPNITTLICSGAEDRALSFVKQIRDVILGDAYQALFPERVPDEPNKDLTEKRIKLKGRTKASPQVTIEGWGYTSNLTGAHFDFFVLDDLVGETNCSPVELERVRAFLANLPGLYMPGKRTRLHVGTRWDEEDDSYTLEGIPDCLTVVVPIEEHEGYIEDLSVRGTPTNPDPMWHPAAAVEALFATIVSNPNEGPVSWRKNFLLNPSAGGGRIFPPHIVDGSQWTPEKRKDRNGVERVFITRPERDPRTKAILKDADGDEKWIRLDPQQLYIVLAVDQSFADTGDEWAISVVGADKADYRYQLQTLTGHGFDAMWEWILALALKWKPKRIGLEKGAAQETTIKLQQRSDKFAAIAGLIEGVSHSNQPKVWRIQNHLAEPMKMGRYLLNPDDTATRSEMKAYKGPGPKAKDNILDSLAIADVLIRKPYSGAELANDMRNRPNPYAGWLDIPTVKIDNDFYRI